MAICRANVGRTGRSTHYIHGAVANINGFSPGWETAPKSPPTEIVFEAAAKFRGPPRYLDVRAISVCAAPCIA